MRRITMALTDPLQWIIIAAVVVVFLFFGPKKIPELARSLGLARKEFQSANQSVQDVAGKLKDPDALIQSLSVEPQQPVPVQSSPPASTTVTPGSDDSLLDAARRLGISTAGKTMGQISEEIMARANPVARP